MREWRILARVLLAGCLAAGAGVMAQAPAPRPAAAASAAQAGFGSLVGRWVRPDGGYVIAIKAAEASAV